MFAQQAWGTLHTLLEIFSYRLHHIQAHYRLNLLTHLHQLAAHNILNNHAQLHLTVESSALRLITGNKGQLNWGFDKFHFPPRIAHVTY